MLLNRNGGDAIRLTEYNRTIFRPECNLSFTSVHCVVHLNKENRTKLSGYLAGFVFEQVRKGCFRE